MSDIEIPWGDTQGTQRAIENVARGLHRDVEDGKRTLGELKTSVAKMADDLRARDGAVAGAAPPHAPVRDRLADAAAELGGRAQRDRLRRLAERDVGEARADPFALVADDAPLRTERAVERERARVDRARAQRRRRRRRREGELIGEERQLERRRRAVGRFEADLAVTLLVGAHAVVARRDEGGDGRRRDPRYPRARGARTSSGP